MKSFLCSLAMLVMMSGCAKMSPVQVPNFTQAQSLYQPGNCQIEGRVYEMGGAIPYTDDTFSIDNILVEYSPAVTSIMSGGQSYGDYSYPLYIAAKENRLKRLDGEEVHTIFLNNLINTAFVPDYVPYKRGWGRCGGMARVKKSGPHSLEVTFPIEGGSGLGQGGVVFPRKPLQTRNLAVCSGTSIEVLFTPELTRGWLQSMPNTLCDVAYHAGDRALSGKSAILFGYVAAAHVASSIRGVR